MSDMRRLKARTLSREYDILVGDAILDQLGGACWLRAEGGQAVVCTDENVAPHYLEKARASLTAAGYAVSHVVIPAGEQQKSLARAEELYGVLYDRHVRRSDVLVALGGGVVGDLAGYVAATFLRGVRLVQVPTTLLAQVDAAAGGKVAVDFRSGKNYIGTFYQPCLVLVDLGTLATLSARELTAGLAEVAKYALLAGGDLLSRVEGMCGDDPRVSAEVVAACIQYKLDVVAEDERDETGARELLNLGHTIGHAIEVATSYTGYSHGEAVSLGLRAALWLSRKVLELPARDEARGDRLLGGLGLPARLAGASPEAVVRLIGRDKKQRNGRPAYVLLEAIGKPHRGVAVPEGLEQEVVTWLARR
jgi:3-dehydroquinate synthase